jgi:hypothetical protein
MPTQERACSAINIAADLRHNLAHLSSDAFRRADEVDAAAAGINEHLAQRPIAGCCGEDGRHRL